VYTIDAARLDDLPLLPSIELAAARLLEGHAPASVLQETTSRAELIEAQRQGLLWVARDDGTPIGFAHVTLLESSAAHLAEIDVLPAHGRRGLGRQLVMTVCRWAEQAGYDAVTLTTFRNVPWNMPFYAKLGFAEIPPAETSRPLLEVILEETRRGLDPAKRVVMRRPCAGVRISPA
jgi:GNAT superfamily N-acetyltransferase